MSRFSRVQCLRQVSVAMVLPVLAGLAMCLLPMGCATVHQARETQRGADKTPGERTVTATELHLGTNSVLTLEQVVRLALSNSPSVFQARQNLIVADAQVRQARAGFLPQLGSSAGYGRSMKYVGPDPEPSESYSFGLSLSEDLFSFGRTSAALRQARAQRAGADASLRAAEAAATYAARVAFYDLYSAQELLLVAEDSVRQFQARLDQVRVMAELGQRIRYDVTKAEVDLGNARLGAIAARNTMQAARATLGRRLGLTEDLSAAIAPPPDPVFDIGERAGLFPRARRHNPDLAALAASIDSAYAGVDEAVADLRPNLSLDAGFSWGGGAFPLTHGWSIGSSLGQSLFSGWRRVSQVDAAAAQLRSARARLADREQQLYQDLTTAFAQLDNAREKLALSALVVRQARENLDLINARYRLGLATAVEVTDAEVALAQARAQQVQARHDALIAVALIRLNLGE